MKIVLVEPDSRGGLIHFAYQLAEALAAEGAQVTLVTGRDYELATLPHRCRVAPILRLWPLVEPPARGPLRGWLRRRLWPLRRGVRALVLAREWLRLVRFVRRARPDVVLLSTLRFRFQSLFLGPMRREGTVLAQLCHEFSNREAGGAPLGAVAAGLADRLFARPYDAFSSIFLFSKAACRDFRLAFPEAAHKAKALPHGPELLFDETPAGRLSVLARYRVMPDDRLVLMFGGLRPSKGAGDLVDAFARIAGQPRTRLLIAGHPSREFFLPGLEAQIARLGLEAQVTLDPRYLGLAELGALVRRADVVAFPYLSATSSGALALAMSLGRPVVVTNVGGLGEAVEDCATGRVVAPADPEALAAAITDLLDHPGAATAMGARAREVLLEERSWPRIAARMLAQLGADGAAQMPGALPRAPLRGEG